MIDKGYALRQTGEMRRTLGLFAVATWIVVAIAQAEALTDGGVAFLSAAHR